MSREPRPLPHPPTRTLDEGYVRKGGLNPAQSQISQRPGPPAPSNPPANHPASPRPTPPQNSSRR